MLEKLLKILHTNGTASIADLAIQLDTSPQMIFAMLETLKSQGFIESLDAECTADASCSRCTLSGLCKISPPSKPRIFKMVINQLINKNQLSK